ncbi:MAG: hypothetical protein ABEJ42_03310 [Halobacteriaceae archaeon]
MTPDIDPGSDFESAADRAADEREHVIEPIEAQGWEHVPPEDVPGWVEREVRDAVRMTTGPDYEYDLVHGDDHVYKVASTVHGTDLHVFRVPKSAYYETTPEAGTCPHCQDYVERDPDDPYLTCPTCGWQYRPWRERLRRVWRALTP